MHQSDKASGNLWPDFEPKHSCKSERPVQGLVRRTLAIHLILPAVMIGSSKANGVQTIQRVKMPVNIGFKNRERNLRSLRIKKLQTAAEAHKQPTGPVANVTLVKNDPSILNSKYISWNFGMMKKRTTPQIRYALAKTYEYTLTFIASCAPILPIAVSPIATIWVWRRRQCCPGQITENC
jgi:hypothetical protein